MEKYLSEPRPEFTRALLRVARSRRHGSRSTFARAELATVRGVKRPGGSSSYQLASAPRWPEFEVITGVTI